MELVDYFIYPIFFWVVYISIDLDSIKKKLIDSLASAIEENKKLHDQVESLKAEIRQYKHERN